MPGAYFLHKHLVPDELIEDATQNLVTLFGGNRFSGARLQGLHGLIELGSGDRFAVHLSQDVRKLRWGRASEETELRVGLLPAGPPATRLR